MRGTSAAVIALLLLASAVAVSAAESPYRVQLLEKSWTPAAGGTAAERGALARAASELAADGRESIHLLVQLYQIPNDDQKLDLWRQGLDLGVYVPGNAFIAAVPIADVASIIARREVRWATHWSADRKIHPNLKAGDVASWARDPERPGWVMTMVLLHHDVDLNRIYSLADEAGGVAMDPIDGIHGATVWLPDASVAKLARSEDVLWIEEGVPPLSATNDGVRAQMNVNTVNGAPYNLDGTGVRVFVFDAGAARPTHETFNSGAGSRVTVIDGSANADHSTHCAGTVGGDGLPTSAGGRARGVAPDVTFLSAAYTQSGGTMLFWDNAGDIQADYALARNTHNADLGSNSIGSNTASNGYPCVREGDYGVTSSLLDGIARGDNATVGSPVIFSWANGNERSGGSPRGRCGANYLTTAEPSCAKNPIHVGALNSDGGSMTRFSSWGPCDDGRMKPVISAPGCESGRVTGETSVFSSFATSDTAYGGFCGTSMATPAVAGTIALFIDDWRAHGFGGANARPLPALVKTMLIHSATDLGQDGPDYIYGYGAVDAKALVDLLRADNGVLGDGGTTAWGTDSASNASIDNFSITVPAGTGVLKATLAWDDAAAAAFAAVAPVNNLTLELIAPDTSVRQAFVLDPANPHLPATTGANTRDNQEQVLVVNPAAGTWTVRVTGTSVPTGPQSYALAYTATPAAFNGGACTTTTSTYEAGLDGWAVTGAAQAAAPAAGHGSFSLRLGGAVSSTHEATRDFAIPAGVGKAELTIFFHQLTDEVAATGFGFDDFFVEVRNTSGTVLSVLDLMNDAWREGAWMDMQNMDLLPWAGQTIRLAFRATNDSSLQTSFYVDDVAVTTCPTGGGGNTPPVVDITGPASGSSFTVGSSITFTGTATDAEDGNLTAGLAWTSSINGAIGSGGSFSTSALSVGTHTITASVTDSGSLTGSDSITVIVNPSTVTMTFTSIGGEDGRVVESGENTNVGGTATASGTGTAALRVGDNNQDRQFKTFVSFDTSSIPDGATVTAATLQLRRGTLSGTNPFGTHGTCQVDIVTGAFGGANALAAADFQAAATSVNVGSLSNPASNGALSTATLNAAGRAAINKTGRTQLRAYFTLDDNDDTGNDYVGFWGGEATTAANRPVLVVTYTP